MVQPRSTVRWDYVAVGQNQWHHFGEAAPPILVYFSGNWDVHWGYGILAHGHVSLSFLDCFTAFPLFGLRVEDDHTLQAGRRGIAMFAVSFGQGRVFSISARAPRLQAASFLVVCHENHPRGRFRILRHMLNEPLGACLFDNTLCRKTRASHGNNHPPTLLQFRDLGRP